MFWTVWTPSIFLLAGIYGYITIEPLRLHSTSEVSCSYHVSTDRILSVQWFKSSRSDVYVQDGEAVAWWGNGVAGGSDGFDMKDDFSLIVNYVNLNNTGLYQCIVTPSGFDAATYEVKLIVYATPSNSIVIDYTRQSNGFINVSCSLHHIYPLNSSEFMSCCGSGSERDMRINSDGTYNVTFTNFLPYSDEDLTIDCRYSNFNYESSSTLRLANAQKDSSNKGANDVSCRGKSRSVHWTGLLILILKGVVLPIFI